VRFGSLTRAISLFVRRALEKRTSTVRSMGAESGSNGTSYVSL